MNPKTFISKTMSVVASLALAIGGSLIATQPANSAGSGSLTWTSGSAPAFYASSGTPAMNLSFVPSSGNASTGYSRVFINYYLTSDANKMTVGNTINSMQNTLTNCKLNSITATSGSQNFLSCSPYQSTINPLVLDFSMGASGGFNISIKQGLFNSNTPGNYTISVSTISAGTAVDEATVSFNVVAPPSISNTLSTTLCGLVGSSMSSGTWTATGLTTPITYSISSGTLPAGLSLSSSTGQVTGTPTAAVTNASIGVLATDSASLTASGQYVITTLSSGSCGGGGGGGQTTCVINGVTQTSITSIVSNTSTLVSGGTYHLDWNGDPTLNSCVLPLNANYGILYVLNGATIGSPNFYQNIVSINMNSAPTTYATLLSRPQFTGVTVRDGDVLKIRYFFGGAQAPTISDSPSFEVTMTLYPGGVVTGGSQSTAQVTRSVERYFPPTPAFQAPILNSLAPKLATGFTAGSGKLVLKDVKPTDIKTVTLNGVAVTVTTTKSGTAIKLPAGASSGALKFTMADGTVVDVPDVKVAPSQVNSNLVDLIPLAATYKSANSVAVPAAIKNAITSRAGIIAQSDMAKCVGYASSNTASARATALTRASNVCGVITDINEGIDPIIKVVVNKVVAKKSPVKYQTW